MGPTEFRTGVIKPFECVKEAWELIKPDYWLLFAILLVGGLIGGFTMYILLGPMICGIMLCFLRRIDGYPVNFDDLWKGFQYFIPSLPVTILFVVPILVWIVVLFVTIYMPIIMAAMMGDRMSSDELIGVLAGALLIDVVVALVMICLHTLLTFSFPLIVDRGMSGLRPAVVSAKAVMKNLGGIGGLIGVNFVLVLLGELACGIGVYFVLPLVMATSLVAYRKVFPSGSVPNLNPPPPNAYSGL